MLMNIICMLDIQATLQSSREVIYSGQWRLVFPDIVNYILLPVAFLIYDEGLHINFKSDVNNFLSCFIGL